MTNSKIITGNDNQILRTISQNIKIKDINSLSKKLYKIINRQKALGLAAPQIGENVRIFLAKIGKSFMILANPKILSQSFTKKIAEEGCLSLPGKWGEVERFEEITVEFLDQKGQKKKMNLKDLDARVVQHEIDHLDGILFTDKLIVSDKEINPPPKTC